jgi:magnesium chelatase subunit I
MRAAFPFTALVGQEELKLALVLAAIDASIGGVMAFGDRGAGKTTAVRGLAALLPPMPVVAGCRFNRAPSDPVLEACEGVCRHGEATLAPAPVVDLPLGATEDRVVGALDLERALTVGEKAFDPGLLARAHRGFLYIDEVNLLEDHLVDLLLDVAASGENVVEREGLSVRHPARFVLVGSGNPEEGELRPQLLDRFGLSVEVTSPRAIAERVEAVRRRDAFDRDPNGFVAAWADAEAALRDRIAAARDRLDGIAAADAVLEVGARLCLAVGADGLRGELTLLRAARALGAFEGAKAVEASHLRRVAPMALRHRLRRGPLDDQASSARIERALDEQMAA